MVLAQLILAATTVAAPVPKENQSPYWAGPDYWDRRHAAKLAEIAAGPKEYDFVFIGDSITHNWEGWSDPIDCAVVEKAYKNGQLKFPNGPGRKVWEEMKGEFRLLNLGCGGDTTQNVLWRLDHGELDGYRTKGVALMIGTNNRESAKAVAEGIKAVVRKILEKQPQAKVILMPIFPCGETQTSDNRMRNADVEWYVRPVADGERVIWLDFNRDFLEPDGTLSPAMMPDYLHPLEPGYRLWRSAIEPVMRRIAHFGAARPVWPADRADRMNDNVRFRGAFDAPAEGTTCALELACSTTYRARLNGEFLSYGPARGPKGKFRIDRIELDGRLKPGRNVLEIEVHGANVNSYEFMDQPSFLQAEVTAGGKVLLATKPGEDGFAAFDWHERVRKVSRFSFQRLWGEAYRVGDGANPPRLTLEERPAVDLLPRDAPLPLCPVSDLRPVATLHRRHDAGKPVELPRYLFLVGHEGFKGYRTGELEVNVTEETLRDSVDGQGPIASTLWKSDDLLAGFVGAEVVCRKPGRFVVFFSEIGSPETGAPPFRNGNDATGAIFWDIRSPGTYVLEGFNPTGARFVETFMHDGEAEVKRVYVREYKSARPFARPFAGKDPDLAKIYSAAANSLSQNAVDVFTDCPGRERAAWIGDTFFTARASAFLTGSTDVERTFLGNYAYADAYEDIPAGEFPMVYPGDHTNGNFIPNFSMWLVLQLSEYAKRGGDLQLVMKMRPKVMALLRHLDGCRNGEGLLENLPGWVFVCWSHANALVKGVNYPSNLQYAGVLDAVAELYGMPELSERAKRIRETVRRKSWNGRWFRDCDWCEDTTECCQYYAFFFGAADRAHDAELWERLVRTCGPDRDAKLVHPELHKSNSIFGYYLRFTLLRDFGERDVLTKELKDYFLPMAKETGTLWEHSGPSGSLAHGLSSYAAVLADFAASR